MPRKGAIRRVVSVLFILLVSFFHSTPAHSTSLRLWVMPNEMVDVKQTADPALLRTIIGDAARKGIFIENETKELARSSYPDWSVVFGYNVAKQQELIEQLSEFIEQNSIIDKIYIEFLRWPDAYHRYASLLASPAPSNPPDIIQMGSTWTAAFAKKGLLLPLNGLFDENNFSSDIMASCRIDGGNAIYAMPWFAETRLIYYWKKYFPKGDESFSTFENFERSLKEMNRVRPFVITIGSPWNLMHNFVPWVWAEGGELVNHTFLPQLYHAPWNEQGFKDAVSFLHKLANSDLLDLPQDTTVNDIELKFVRGKYAAMLTVSDMVSSLPKNWQNEIGVAMPPGGKFGRVPFLGGSHLAVTKFAKEKFKESVELVGYLTNAKNEINYANATGFLPPNRSALEIYTQRHPELSVFKEALRHGRFYPSIPEWGEIFENEIARAQLFNLWNDIALGKPLPVVLATLSDISNQINKRLVQKAVVKYSVPAGIVLALTLAALIISIVLWRKKQSYLLNKLEILGGQLRTLEGQKTLLDGQIALLEKHGGTQADELQRSREKLIRLESQIDGLADKFEHIRAKRYKPASLLKFRIKSDGTVIVNETEVAFENKRQAKHLIEYIVRHTNHKQTTIHCIKGFILFDWTNLREDSNPKRVFDTVVAKINMPLKKAGLPPILVSSGRESWQWSVFWDPKLLEQNTDIMTARKLGDDARECFYSDAFEDAAEKMVDCLRIDPKCIEALSLLQEFRIEELNISQAKLSSLKDLKRISDQILQKYSSQHSAGLAMAKKHIENLKRLSKAERAGRLESELDALEAEINCEKYTISNLFADWIGQPLYLKEINDQLLSIRRNIAGLKEQGLNNCDIWAQITQDGYFLTLLSNPQLNDLIHNFYDHTTKEVEDPRLVKLAMILMLNGDECIKELEGTFDGKVFFKTIEKHLRKQFRSLEQEISQFQIN